MSLPHRVFVTIALVCLAAVPAITAHAVAVHLATLEHRLWPPESVDPGLLLVLALTAVAAFPIGGAVAVLVRSYFSVRRFALIAAQRETRTLNGLTFYRLPDSAIAVFTAGLRRPRIYVTQGAEERLSTEMLQAALLHERAHLQANDTRWRLLLAIFEGALHRIAPVRRYASGLIERSELRADRAAIRSGASKTALFEALVLSCSVVPSTPGLSGGDIVCRLQHLADPALPDEPTGKAPAITLFAWSLALPALAHLMLAAGFICQSHFTA